MYIFPRQFRLRNMFVPTGDANSQFTSHGHIMREEEIFAGDEHPKIPKRLYGKAAELTQSLRVRHARCSYYELLKHYCPTEVGPLDYTFQRQLLTAVVEWTLETICPQYP